MKYNSGEIACSCAVIFVRNVTDYATKPGRAGDCLLAELQSAHAQNEYQLNDDSGKLVAGPAIYHQPTFVSSLLQS